MNSLQIVGGWIKNLSHGGALMPSTFNLFLQQELGLIILYGRYLGERILVSSNFSNQSDRLKKF